MPQSSRSENQSTSFDAGSTRQFAVAVPDSYCVRTVSLNTSRTAPVATSATRKVADLWSRDDETNAMCEPSGYHSTSVKSPLQEMSSHNVERCWSAGIWKRVTFAASTSITTR